MRCLFLKRFINKSPRSFSERYISTGCGKCYSCLSNRRRQWLFRLSCESLRAFKSVFVTLTYDDLHLPPALSKVHFRDFVDNVRSIYPCLYYGIGEFGPRTFRPHYHIVLFFKVPLPNDLDYDRFFLSCWNRGNISCSVAHYRRLNYVLHYHVRPKIIAPGLECFQLYSKGLGSNFLYDAKGDFNYSLVNYLRSAQYPIVQDLQGNYYVIPRYYRRKLESVGLLSPKIFDCDDISDNFSDFAVRHYNVDNVFRVDGFDFSSLFTFMKSKDYKRMMDFDFQNKYFTAYE